MPKTLREMMVDYIDEERLRNSDLFYYKRTKSMQFEHGDGICTNGGNRRWQVDFDFNSLTDERLFKEFQYFMIYSFRQR